jgi:hypothetical protein
MITIIVALLAGHVWGAGWGWAIFFGLIFWQMLVD